VVGLVLVDEDERERLGREVAAADEALVVLLGEQRAGEPDGGGVVGEDADDVARRPISRLTRSSGLVSRMKGGGCPP